jgi:hypothetical protein
MPKSSTKQLKATMDIPPVSAAKGEHTEKPTVSGIADTSVMKRKGKGKEENGTGKSDGHVIWSSADKGELIQFLLEIKCSGHDLEGDSFKASVWADMAAQFKAASGPGANKIAQS